MEIRIFMNMNEEAKFYARRFVPRRAFPTLNTLAYLFALRALFRALKIPQRKRIKIRRFAKRSVNVDTRLFSRGYARVFFSYV